MLLSDFEHSGFVCHLCAYTVLHGCEAVVKFVCAANFPIFLPSMKTRGERQREKGGGDGGEGGAFHRHAKTFRGKPSQIFPTVCGERSGSPVTRAHTYTHTHI